MRRSLLLVFPALFGLVPAFPIVVHSEDCGGLVSGYNKAVDRMNSACQQGDNSACWNAAARLQEIGQRLLYGTSCLDREDKTNVSYTLNKIAAYQLDSVQNDPGQPWNQTGACPAGTIQQGAVCVLP